MSYSLNSLKGLYMGLYKGLLYGFIKGDTRSLDCSSYGGCSGLRGWGFSKGPDAEGTVGI